MVATRNLFHLSSNVLHFTLEEWFIVITWKTSSKFYFSCPADRASIVLYQLSNIVQVNGKDYGSLDVLLFLFRCTVQ